MRIAFLLTQDLESPSGLGRYWPVAKALAQSGHDITILALHSDYESLRSQERDNVREGVRVRYVGPMHVRKVGDRKFYFKPLRLLLVALVSTAGLTVAALSTPTDAYHVGKPHPMNGLAGLIASKLRRKPLYLDCDDLESASNQFTRSWQREIVSFVERRLPLCCDAVTVNTRFLLELMKEWGVPRQYIRWVPNGFDPDRFHSVSAECASRLRAELGLEKKKVVLYLGSISLTSHPLTLLLEAFRIVRDAEPEAVLLLVGGGEDYDKLRKQADHLRIADQTVFVGRVPPENVPLYLAIATVSVDPVHDGPVASARSPLKVVESIAAGVPVVTGDVGDRRRLMNDGALGTLVPPGDTSALASGLLSLLQDSDRRRRVAQAALEAREHWSWNKLVGGFLETYESTR